MRVAILDLGTNTFNLLIAEKKGSGEIQLLHNQKIPVKLGEGGINRGEIIQEAFDRGIAAVLKHFETIKALGVEKIQAFGTSALRTAANGELFINTIFEKTGISISIITGDLEAELIYFGVRQTYPIGDEVVLILDIGGGSNEIILADGKTIFWKKSYKLGIARLLEKFNPSDPITSKEISAIEKYFTTELADLFVAVEKYKPLTLLGASGSFETFYAMLNATGAQKPTEESTQPKSENIPIKDFYRLYHTLIDSTTRERADMPGLEPMRIEMIVLACLFVKFLVNRLKFTNIVQSNFALKEGALYKLFSN